MTVSTHQVGATCPSCGRFVGPLGKCPYCGADIKKRVPLRYLKLACLVLSILGVVILVFAASGAATPTTKIGNIGATMNYAYVRLEGTVTRGPLYDPDAQSLRFYVADDTSEIQAGAFREVTQDLIAADKIPTVGDRVILEGTLRVRDDFTSLNLSSADRVEIFPPTAKEITLGEVGYDDEWRYVALEGDVRDIRQPYEGLTLITLGDAGGELDVAMSGDIEKLRGALPAFELGDAVAVKGIITYFRDSPQLVLRHPNDFKKLELDNTAAATARIGEIDATRVNQRVQVSGQVTRVSKFSQGMRATLADETGEITLVLWQDVYAQIPNMAELQKGAQVQALGKVSQYRGAFEIVPQRASDVKISASVAQNSAAPSPSGTATLAAALAPTATPRPTREPTAAPTTRTIASLTPADKDARVVVTGAITRANSFSQGMRYTLDDGTGKITLLIWKDVVDALSIRDALIQGAQVRVTGKVDVFNDELEIIPERASDVELIAAAQIPTVERRGISSLSSADLDKFVSLRGAIVEISDFSKGKYVMLQDDSGKIQITVFSNLLQSIQDKLAIGAKAAVRGKVNLFRGKMEIVAEDFVIE